MKKIIFATGNQDKMREIHEILADMDVEVVSMKEAGIHADIVENGSTFEENAVIKAKTICELTGEITLADDSGLEIDYLNEESNPSVVRFRELPLDYRIGSVHLLYDDKGEIVDVDVTADKFCRVVDKHFNGDLVRVVHLYYDRLMRMVELGGFDIVGHADKMHYNASAYHPGLLDEPWYDALIQEYFDAIARKGYIVEINTKSYLELGTFYPNERYFPVLLEKGIRVQVNSDSHYPERINNGRPQALMALQASGYHTVTEMYNNEWKDMPLLIHT